MMVAWSAPSRVVAEESGLLGGRRGGRAGGGCGFLPTGPPSLSLSRQPLLETLFVQDEPVFVRDLLHQVQGQAVGVIELEHDLPRQPARLAP